VYIGRKLLKWEKLDIGKDVSKEETILLKGLRSR
jgi:hypothetical protein